MDTPIARARHYVAMRKAQPLKSLGDAVHAIHAGTEYEAELSWSDLQSLVASLTTLTSQRDMLVKALEEIANADWPGVPANHRLSKAREIAREALQAKEGV